MREFADYNTSITTYQDPCVFLTLLGYLDHKKYPPRRISQLSYAQGPMVILWGGGVLISEVPLRAIKNPDGQEGKVRRCGQGPDSQRLQCFTGVPRP